MLTPTMTNLNYTIDEYTPAFESQWVRCRTLAFLDSAYFDDVLRRKEIYNSPSIELIAIQENRVIGLIDIECEENPGEICSPSKAIRDKHISGMIWHLAVHPDFRRMGIAALLFNKAVTIAKEKKIKRFEAWTRDDQFVLNWYVSQSFNHIDAYIQWYYDSQSDATEILHSILQLKLPESKIQRVYGISKGLLKEIDQLSRYYTCNRFDFYIV